MKMPNKCAIVGAGGIACYLAPMLSKLTNIVLIDADDYEPKNSTRQFPALKSKGNKARVLSGILSEQTIFKAEAIEAFLQDVTIVNNPEWEGVDMIFGAVDNNRSRAIIKEVCEALEIPGIIAGNADQHGDAHAILPNLYNPFDHYEFPDNTPAPWSCNSDKQLEERPQTAIANMLAAGSAMHILMSYLRVNNPMFMIAHVRQDALMGQVVRVVDLVKKEQNTHKEDEHQSITTSESGKHTGTGEGQESVST